MTLTKQYFTTTEALEDILDVLESGYDGSMDDLHNEVFNTGYYIIGTYQAKQALTEYGVFEAIEKVQEYEDNAFGELYTDVSDPEKLANMLYYIIGEEVINDLALVKYDNNDYEATNKDMVEIAIKLVKEALEREAGE